MKKCAGFSLAVLATAILLLCHAVPRASAQDQNYDQDPPTRAGRISDVEGSVSFQPGGQGDWLEVVRNRPLTVGDNLWVDKDSRAEIQIGSTSIRLAPETSLTFVDLGNNVTQLRLSVGSLFFRVRRFDRDDAFEVDTPNLAFNVYQPGEFRLDVNQNGDQTMATVWHGEGEITGAGNSYRLNEGQEGTFSGTDQLSYDVAEIQQPDSFGQWAQSRDAREDRARSSRYVSSDMTGYEDLDDYGRWHSDPQYGNVWQPSGVPGDWAPYRYGHWAYVYPWGWTWVEDEQWGFAPFHYGRWAYSENSWCWVPGPVAVAPVYAPALVAFIGGGLAVGVGGGVGWFPLGPGEVFVPWYQTSPRYVQNVNVTNTRVSVVQVTNVYNNYTVNHVNNVTYVNQRVNNSVTVVNHETFVNARPVHQNIEHVDARQLASARVSPAEVTRVQPARQSVVGVSHPVQSRPPAQVMSRQVVATRQPVAYNRAAGVPETGRPAAPPPMRTVRAEPPGQAQQLQRGARGGQPNNGAPNNNAGGARPGGPGGQPNPPENRGAAPRPGGPGGQPNAPDNRGAVPRPGGPGGQPNAPDNRGAVPRPGGPNGQPNAPENRGGAPRPGGAGGQPNAAQPNAPDNRGAAPRPGAPNNPDARPNAPENNRNVPRPGGPSNNNPPGARPNENAPRPGAPDNRPAPPENRSAPPENARPSQPVPRPPSANPPEQQPRQYPGTRPENNRPQQPQQTPPQQPNRSPEPSQTRQVQPARPPEPPPQVRPQQPTRVPETPQTRPEQPARPPEARQQPAPRQPESRPAPPPQRAEPPTRSAPPPQARPAEPPPQRDNRPAPQNDRRNPPPDKKDKQPPQSR